MYCVDHYAEKGIAMQRIKFSQEYCDYLHAEEQKTLACGIYEIVCTANGKRYIGQAKDMADRLARHRRSLMRGRHHNKYLLATWNKYGPDKFVFNTVMVCAPAALTMYEQLVADFYRDTCGIFNFGDYLDCPRRGQPHTEASRQKMRDTLSEPEAYARLCKRSKESHNTPEYLEAASRRHTENWQDPEYAAKVKVGMKRGWAENKEEILKKFNLPEVKQKKSAAGKANWQNPEYREKTLESRRNSEAFQNSHNEDWRQAVSASHKERWRAPEFRARRSAQIKASRSTPEAKKRQSKKTTNQWARLKEEANGQPVERLRLSQNASAARDGKRSG